MWEQKTQEVKANGLNHITALSAFQPAGFHHPHPEDITPLSSHIPTNNVLLPALVPRVSTPLPDMTCPDSHLPDASLAAALPLCNKAPSSTPIVISPEMTPSPSNLGTGETTPTATQTSVQSRPLCTAELVRKLVMKSKKLNSPSQSSFESYMNSSSNRSSVNSSRSGSPVLNDIDFPAFNAQKQECTTSANDLVAQVIPKYSPLVKRASANKRKESSVDQEERLKRVRENLQRLKRKHKVSSPKKSGVVSKEGKSSVESTKSVLSIIKSTTVEKPYLQALKPFLKSCTPTVDPSMNQLLDRMKGPTFQGYLSKNAPHTKVKKKQDKPEGVVTRLPIKKILSPKKTVSFGGHQSVHDVQKIADSSKRKLNLEAPSTMGNKCAKLTEQPAAAQANTDAVPKLVATSQGAAGASDPHDELITTAIQSSGVQSGSERKELDENYITNGSRPAVSTPEVTMVTHSDNTALSGDQKEAVIGSQGENSSNSIVSVNNLQRSPRGSILKKSKSTKDGGFEQNFSKYLFGATNLRSKSAGEEQMVKVNRTVNVTTPPECRPKTAGLTMNTAEISTKAAEFMPNRAEFMTNTAEFKPNEAEFKPNQAEFKPNTAELKPNTVEFRPNKAEFKPNTAGFRPNVSGELCMDTKPVVPPPISTMVNVKPNLLSISKSPSKSLSIQDLNDQQRQAIERLFSKKGILLSQNAKFTSANPNSKNPSITVRLDKSGNIKEGH